MAGNEWMVQQFEEKRAHMRAVAYRILGSRSEADDAVQETWLRLSRADATEVQNLGGWLTTVVSRVCLDVLRARKARREEAIEGAREGGAGTGPAGAAAHGAAAASAEDELMLADAVGPALLVVLETLAPAERVAFVLHDVFDLSFEEIAPIVGRTEAATRQLASRARRRVRGGEASAPRAEGAERRGEIVAAFMAASRDGDIAGLLAVLAPGVVLQADEEAVRTAAMYASRGAPVLEREIRGARAVAEVFNGRARGALPAWIDGEPGAVWMHLGIVRGAFRFTVGASGQIEGIDLVLDPERVKQMKVEIQRK